MLVHLIDVIVIAAVLGLLVLAARKLFAGGGECSSCSSSSVCSAADRAQGKCAAVDSMLADAEKRLQR